MIDFTVLGGYLGAGKTTLLNHLLRHNKGQRIALLINDFGEINIDARLITSQTDSQINLANGCVCCTLSNGFADALEQLQGQDPDHIVVEASGVADVHRLAQYGHGHGLRLAGVLVVADAETVKKQAADKYVGATVRRQLQAADLILLNKADLCTPEQIKTVHNWISEIVPACPVVKTVKCQIPIDLVTSVTVSQKSKPEEDSGHARFQSWSFRSSSAVTEEQVKEFADSLGAEIIRSKGLLKAQGGGVIELQVVGRRHAITVHHDDTIGENQIVALGLEGQLETSALDNLAKKSF